MKQNIIYYEELASTNVKVKELALEHAEGLVVVAKRQTAGRGRRGRSWESPEGNLYLSLLLKPEISINQAPMLTIVMAHSLAEFLRSNSIPVGIKWPNDLILNNKKMCGILTEMEVRNGQIDFVVVGVGVNYAISDFSEELQETATSILQEVDTVIEREELIKGLLDFFEQNYAKFIECGDVSFLQKDYQSMLLNCGREVRVLEPGNEYVALAKGINEKGELLVETLHGEERVIYAGEVSVRGVCGYV